MRTFVGLDMRQATSPDSMGVVTDVRYHRCLWPDLALPTSIFAIGSAGIVVDGPNTPRNVIFPADTQFPDYLPDALYPPELALAAAYPTLRKLHNLSEDQVAVYLAAYEKAATALPSTAAKHQVVSNCFFLRHIEVIAVDGAKPQYQKYVAPLSRGQAEQIVAGGIAADQIKNEAVFVKAEHSLAAPDTAYFAIVAGKPVDITADLEGQT